MKEMIYGGEGGLLGVEDIGDGYKLAVVSIAGSHPCAYVQFPGIENLCSYEHIKVKAKVHGGFTFLGMLWNGEEYGLPGIWLGWDYAHFDDYVSFLDSIDGKKWTTAEMIDECKNVINQIIDIGFKNEKRNKTL